MYISLFLLVVFFVLNTSIISEKVSEKVKTIEKKGFKKKKG